MSSAKAVFVVDDDEASALSLQALLGAFGFQVSTFRSAEEFLSKTSTQFGCLVLDLRLPGMSGLELQKELTARGQHLPIVMISGHADDPSHRQALENGAVAFLQKPFSGASLRDEIQRALGSAPEGVRNLET